MSQAEIRRRQAHTISYVIALVTLGVTARLAGYDGVTYVAAGFWAYLLVSVLVCGGITDALGRVLRLRNSKGQYRNAFRMRKNAFLLQAALGLAGMAVLLLAAERITVHWFHIRYSTLILTILAPAVLLQSISAVLMGYSRGEGAELSGIAAILRQLLILGFSFLFCRMLGNYGGKVSRLLGRDNFTSMYGGVGFSIAVPLAEVLIVALLSLIYFATRKRQAVNWQEGMRTMDSVADSIRILCSNRLARLGILLTATVPLPLGLFLLQGAAEDPEAAAVQYGIYVAGYVVLCGVPAIFITLLLISVCGRMMTLMRKEENRYAKAVFQSGVHVIGVYGAFAAVFLAVMSRQFAELFCPEQAALAARMLAGGSSALLFMALAVYFARILVLTGRKTYVLGAAAAADLLYAVTALLMLNLGKAGVLALVYAGTLGSGALCVVLGLFAYRQMRQRVDWLHMAVVPVAAACVSGLFALLVSKVLQPHLGIFFTLVICLILSTALYWCGLLLLRNVREQELENFPGGKLLNAVGQMLKVF